MWKKMKKEVEEEDEIISCTRRTEKQNGREEAREDIVYRPTLSRNDQMECLELALSSYIFCNTLHILGP